MDRMDVVDALVGAVNARDVEALVGCFADGYRNETPAHPARGFIGSDQVRTNWERLFAGVPDLRAEVVRTARDDTTIWSEWQMDGTRPDGTPHLMRGVIIFGVDDDRISWARFYLEPVDPGEDGVDAAISRIVGPGARS